ncbi:MULTISPECIES: HEPN domain-containing protein [Flavobacteriaceae]|uniref:HEPN domain-containing protein n=2 Tax=Flavobacteriaceae TaxID=49546 RepID=A0A4Y8AT57_9FLAO|nr:MULTISPECIES: HEPN domain-containing protein [Flavobacteriaceae]TEW75054.1 HEPN domain-containing protein [Gramella jeungdoensis]GGK41977.1 ferredoxin--nitrite reductase [Lutibacter litoralis]
MQSFRSEIENPIVERDIIDLEKKIQQFYNGEIDEARFRSLRLARGVYGQRQFGVQMIRIKLPYGKVTSEQLHRIANVSDEYSRGRLHITTRQDIQIHHVSLDRTPELWAELEKDDITLREACGNAVRNVTASETAGIDPNEPFDVSLYAHATFEFFLRNPICQELGRKFKISFSGTDEDTALSFMHDLGFIAKIKDGVIGFKVMVAGGLGSQARLADTLFEFVEADKIIPITEAVLRVFDRYGERSKRAKARLKFLIKDVGFNAFIKLIEDEQKALSVTSFPIDTSGVNNEVNLPHIKVPSVEIKDEKAFELWKKTNVIHQKQDGFSAIGIKVYLGDFYTDEARMLADLIKNYAGNEIRLTLRQNILIRHVKNELLPFFYNELSKLGFATIGYNSTLDITSCPGTDTCNLGIASSTGISAELEKVLRNEYPQYANNKEITIKISGCMNSCGQHTMAHIGFQGMSIKSGNLVAPALQVLLGGSVLGNGAGRIADKVLKIPSKRGPQALRSILNDYEANVSVDESFINYYDRQGERYFYNLLKPLADTTNLEQSDFIDWGSEEAYEKAVGVGECAGVVIDLIATLLLESEEKLENALESLKLNQFSDSIYYTYSSIVNTAKALLTSEGKKTNTHVGIISQFDEFFGKEIDLGVPFSTFIYQIKNNEPTEEFAEKYLEEAQLFYEKVNEFRTKTVSNEN